MPQRTATALDFPTNSPEGFPPLASEPVFDPAKHLAIEMPKTITSLKELGYRDAEIETCPCDLGITSTFRILSDEGAACLLEVARQLEPFATSNARVARNVRGGTYRSKFLRDLCLSPDVTDTISKICGTPLLPHTIPHQLGHMNYNPLKVGQNVDKWHTDTLRIDFVMFVTDPNTVEGGEFEYFRGTKEDAAALAKAGKPMSPDRVVAAALPGPGYAVLQQGNMVVHRAKGLRKPGERITMVNGYVPADPAFADFSRFDQLKQVDPPHVVGSEYTRHVAWMGREALDAQLSNLAFTSDKDAMAAELERVATLLSDAAAQLRDDREAEVEHFGDE